jgi:hypothetical protein
MQTSIGHLICNGLRDELQVDCVLFDGGNIRANCDYDVLGLNGIESDVPRIQRRASAPVITTRSSPALVNAGNGGQPPPSRYAFTLADLETELPWATEMGTVEMTGTEIAEVVRWSRSHLPAEFGGFLQHDDSVMTDPNDQGKVTHVADDEIDLEASYRVGIIHDSLTGMNSHPVFKALRTRLGKSMPPIDAARPAKVLLLSHFARRAWAEMPDFENMDTERKGFLTYKEVREGYLFANESTRARSRTEEQERATDIMISQMMSLAGGTGETVSQMEYEQVFGPHLPPCRSRSQSPRADNRLPRTGSTQGFPRTASNQSMTDNSATA